MFARSVGNSEMSFPGANAWSPAPRRITHRTSSMSATARAASPRRCHIGLVSALSFSGRLSVIMASGPSRASRIMSVVMSVMIEFESAIEKVDEAHAGDGDIRHQQQDRNQHGDKVDVHLG